MFKFNGREYEMYTTFDMPSDLVSLNLKEGEYILFKAKVTMTPVPKILPGDAVYFDRDELYEHILVEKVADLLSFSDGTGKKRAMLLERYNATAITVWRDGQKIFKRDIEAEQDVTNKGLSDLHDPSKTTT